MKLIRSLAGKCRNDLFFITVIYFITFGIILLNEGIFFDDWVIFHADNAAIMKQMRQVGMPWLGYYNLILFSFNNMLVCRAVVFFCYLFSALFLYGVLKTIPAIEAGERFFITLFFMLFPVNFARLPQSTSHYAVSYFLFYLGLFSLSRYLFKRNLMVRILALASFFFSFFSLPSLLVFYGIVLLFIAYTERANSKTIKGALFLAAGYLDFLAAPVIFWVIKIIFFKPYGLYAGHNEINVPNFFTALYKLNGTFYASFMGPLGEALRSPSSNYLPIIMLALFISIFVYRICFVWRGGKVGKNDFFLLFFGFFAFVIGVYGYLVVNKMPISSEWYSRFQILVPLGAGFIIVYSVKALFSNTGRVFVYSLLLVLFVFTNFREYLNYQKDWFKQLALIENFKDSEVVKSNTAFVFKDRTMDLNFRYRTYYFYEFAGLMKLAFGDERRFGTVIRADFSGTTEKNIKLGHYNCGEFRMQNPQYEVIIDYGQYKLGYSNTLKLLVLKLAQSTKFKENIKNIIRLEYAAL